MSDQWAKGFNQWMDDYTNNPKAYEAIELTAIAHLREKLQGREPTYGESAAATFSEYLKAA